MTRATRLGRSVVRALAVAGGNAAAGSALAQASSQVIASRVALGMLGAADPMAADYRELARILPEKAEASAASGMIMVQRSGRAAQQVATYAANEMMAAGSAAIAMAACRSPAALVAAQASYAQAWLGRAMAQSMALGTMAMRTQRAVAAPFHQAATANARRLGR